MTKIIGINYKTTNAQLTTNCGFFAPPLSQNCIKFALLQPK